MWNSEGRWHLDWESDARPLVVPLSRRNTPTNYCNILRNCRLSLNTSVFARTTRTISPRSTTYCIVGGSAFSRNSRLFLTFFLFFYSPYFLLISKPIFLAHCYRLSPNPHFLHKRPCFQTQHSAKPVGFCSLLCSASAQSNFLLLLNVSFAIAILVL